MRDLPPIADLQTDLHAAQALRSFYAQEHKQDTKAGRAGSGDAAYYAKLIWDLDGQIADLKSRIAARRGR